MVRFKGVTRVIFTVREGTLLNNKILQIFILIITLSIALASGLTQVSAQTTDNSTIPTSGASAPDLVVEISSNHTVSLSMGQLYAMPQTTVDAELSCDGRLIKSGTWGGVSLKTLLQECGFSGQTANLQFYASDGYRVPFYFSEATPDTVIVSYELSGSTLPEKLRLVIPDANGEGWIAMITEISLIDPSVPAVNPAAATVIKENQNQQSNQTPAPTPSPTPEPTVQPTAQPTPVRATPTPPSANEPSQQQSSTNSNVSNQSLDLELLLIVLTILAVVLPATYVFYKRRK